MNLQEDKQNSPAVGAHIDATSVASNVVTLEGLLMVHLETFAISSEESHNLIIHRLTKQELT